MHSVLVLFAHPALEAFYRDATRVDLRGAAGAARTRLRVLALDDAGKDLAEERGETGAGRDAESLRRQLSGEPPAR